MHREFARGVCVGAVLMAIAVVRMHNRYLICCTAHQANADGHANTDTVMGSTPIKIASQAAGGVSTLLHGACSSS
jgi:hypothetical protein